ncbi:MAG: FAD-binding oxidoreductase, partial [Beijerinckiaceae bacterium]
MTAIAFPAPKADIIARRAFLIEGLAKLVPPASLITSEDERRPYETDAFTAYKRMPLIVVLPETTGQVSAVLKFGHDNGVPVVPRGAGTSLCGGSTPQEDAVVIGVAKMNRILDVNYGDRT